MYIIYNFQTVRCTHEENPAVLLEYLSTTNMTQSSVSVLSLLYLQCCTFQQLYE